MWPDTNISKHAIILGSTGSGKTNLIFVLIKNTIRKTIFINGKYTNGQIFQQLSSTNVSSTNIDFNKDPILYNPFKNKNIDQVISLLMEIHDFSKKVSNNSTGVGYYLTQEKYVLKICLSLLKYNQLPLTMNNILLVLDRKNINKLNNKNIPEEFKNNILKIKLDTIKDLFIKLSEVKDIVCIAKNNNGHTLENLIMNNKQCIVFDINTTSSLNGKLLGKILQYDMKIYKDNKKDDKEVMLIMDEFGSYANEYTKDLLEQGRSKNISVVIGLQSPSQLEQISLQYKKTIFNNTKTFFLFQFNDDVQFINNIFGNNHDQEQVLSSYMIKNTLKIGECWFITQEKNYQYFTIPIKVVVPLIN